MTENEAPRVANSEHESDTDPARITAKHRLPALLGMVATALFALALTLAMGDASRLAHLGALTNSALATIVVFGLLTAASAIFTVFLVGTDSAVFSRKFRIFYVCAAVFVLAVGAWGYVTAVNAQKDAQISANGIGVTNSVTAEQIAKAYNVKVSDPATGSINRASTSKITVMYLGKEVKCFTPDAQSLIAPDPLVCENGLVIGAAPKGNAK